MELARSDQSTCHRGSGQVADAFKAHVLLGRLLGIRVADTLDGAKTRRHLRASSLFFLSGIWDATPWIGRIVRGGHAPLQFSCDHCSPPPSRDSRDATSGCETQESSCRRCGQCRIIGVISDQRGGVLGGLRFQRVCSSPRPISLTKALQRPHSSTPAALLASH